MHHAYLTINGYCRVQMFTVRRVLLRIARPISAGVRRAESDDRPSVTHLVSIVDCCARLLLSRGMTMVMERPSKGTLLSPARTRPTI